MRILIVDDERTLADALKEILKRNQFTADAVYDGADGLEYALTGVYDIIILDIMLPGLNGYEVLREIRRNKLTARVLMLSAKSDVPDKVLGLETGADDYLTKPFATAELLARIKALSRRDGNGAGDTLTFGNLRFEKTALKLECGAKTAALGIKEAGILEQLMRANGKIVDKDRLSDKIFGFDRDSEYNAIEVYVSFLRKKLDAVGADAEIKSVRGAGYSLQRKEKC